MPHTLSSSVGAGSEPTRFPLPNDGQAWWSVLSCLVLGWMLSIGPRLEPQGVALAIAALALFLGSEWFSRLAGRSRQGAVARTNAAEPLGLILVTATAICLLWFLWMTEAGARQAWGSVIIGVACLVALMFILRLEWRPLDGRLLYLTHLILTLPALMFGFVHWGVLAPQAFGVWILPAAYFPAQALFSQFWMEGLEAPKDAMSLLAGPLLLATLFMAARGAWFGVSFMAIYLLWVLARLLRRRSSPGGLPGFAEVRRLNWEIQAWNAAALAAWALSLTLGVTA
jgi:hypothetical protein